MNPLRPCAACGVHIRAEACVCPHCGGSSCAQTPGRTATAALLGLVALGGCQLGGKNDVALYGVEVMDVDGDGWFEGEDCDDNDESIHPDAPETPGDGVDSDCDGFDDPQGDTGDTAE